MQVEQEARWAFERYQKDLKGIRRNIQGKRQLRERLASHKGDPAPGKRGWRQRCGQSAISCQNLLIWTARRVRLRLWWIY